MTRYGGTALNSVTVATVHRTATTARRESGKMLIAILILTIFNTGLIILTIGGLVVYKDEIEHFVAAASKHTDESIETATTALYNMDSIKQKVEMTGRFEL